MFLSLKRTRWLILFAIVLAFVPLSIANPATAQTSTGAGSYATTLPPGATAPQPTIYKTANVTTKMPTNEWWSSLAWKRYPNASENMLPHPLSVKAKTDGLGLGYPTNQTVTGDGRKYEYVYTEDLTVGVNGLNAAYTDVKVDGFSDWTVSIDWATGQFKATVGHGLPFVYLTKGSGNALVKFNAPPTVQSNSGSAVHVVVNGHAYGLYAPAGSTWTQSGNNFESTLAGKDYYSVAALPDSNAATFNDFKAHAMAFVTGTSVSWSYNPANALVSTTYTINTVAKEGTELRTLFALYPHQWLYTAAPNTSYTYVSPRGTMKVVRGTSFATSMKFSGVLPYLPDVGAYDRTKLYNYINDIYALSDDARMNFPGPNGERDTYWTGKGLGRLAMLVPIAEQVGHTAARDSFLATLKSRLQNWYTASAGETGNLFYYDNNWGTLIGYPANYGSETELNDHHFHYAYYVVAAATVALYDHTWSNSTNWGPMTELLIKDAANWDSNAEPRFPRLRNFDPYAGHSWASGSQAFAAGNNQESSSESMNFNYGLILWGAATGNTTIRDLGIYLYTTEAAAIDNYWFDVNNNIFPNTNYSHNYAAMVWSDGASYSTWWTANAEEIHGINILPVTGGSLYLGKYPSYVNGFYQEMVANNGGTEYEWSDIIWEYQAFADPNAAMSKFGTGSYSGLAQEWGETKAHTYHWIGNLQALGTFNYTVTGNAPLSAVFTKNGTNTYVAYNPSGAGVTVTFSNGASLFVPAWSMATSNGVAVPTSTPTITPTPSNTSQYSPTPTRTPTATTTVATFQPPTSTATATATNNTGGFNAYSVIRAEARTSASGVNFETCSEGGQDATNLANGDYLVFDNVNFGSGGVYQVNSRIASGAAGGISGLIEYWIDGLTTAAGGTKLGDFALANTAGWQAWTTTPAGASNATGVHRVYVKFTSGQPADFVNLQWFQFLSSTATVVSTTPAPTATPSRTPTRTNTAVPSNTPTRTNTPLPTSTPTATNTTSSSMNPFAQVRAENRTTASGIFFETCSEGGQDAAGIANGDYLSFDNVNFGTGGATRIDSRVASGAAGGVSGIVEYWIDGLTTATGGTKLGDFALSNTGGWQSWTTIPAGTINVTGTHRVYVKFTSGQPADFVNLQWFVFVR